MLFRIIAATAFTAEDVDYKAGDLLGTLESDVPFGTLLSVTRTGLATCEERDEEKPPKKKSGNKKEGDNQSPSGDPGTTKTDAGDPAPSLGLATPVDQLDLKTPVKKALTAAGLETAQAVIDFGSEHDGLTSIKGISDAGETAIQEAIKKVLPEPDSNPEEEQNEE